MHDNDTYNWLKSHQSITIPSGGSYEIRRFQETIALIDSLVSEIERLREENDHWRRMALSFTSYED